MPHDLFLAHAGADTDRCRPLVAALRALGLTVFFDKDGTSIPLGADWDLEIPRALAASRATVPCLSRAYDAALYERAEVHLALDLRKRSGHQVFPVYLDGPPGPTSVFYGLNVVQGVDINVGVDEVARQIAAALGGTTAPVIPAAPVVTTPALTAPDVAQKLRRLTPASFDEIVFTTGFDRSLLLPDTVPLAQRAMNLVLHAEETDAAWAKLLDTIRVKKPGLL